MAGILVICSSYRPDVGGAETHLQDLVSYCKRRRHKVTVVTLQPYQSAVSKVQRMERNGGVTIIRLPRPCRSFFFAGSRWRPIGQIFYLPLLLAYSVLLVWRHQEMIDVIHTHGILSVPIGCFVSKLFKKRHIMSLHHTFIPYGSVQKSVARLILSLPDRVLCLSKRSKLELLRIGLKPERVQAFTYWVDQTKFQPLDKGYCKKLLKLEDKFVILFVGRLIEEKGINVLIDVANELVKLFDDMIFAFVGVGPLEQTVVDASKIVKNVRFLGVVKNEQLRELYNAADVVVVPSINEEGFGRVILESLACGTPVIASNKGGIPEALDPSVSILVEPTAETLAKAVTLLYFNRDEVMRMANNCRVFAQKRFNEDNAQLIEEIYFPYFS